MPTSRGVHSYSTTATTRRQKGGVTGCDECGALRVTEAVML